MPEPNQTVVIVGASPTGLALGAELKRLDISSLILDRIEAGVNTSRAAVGHVVAGNLSLEQSVVSDECCLCLVIWISDRVN
jgi:2-polyprenyl-6-methoxyphenol hydroxylase-like FAD-dependent oxidoreductase